MAFLRFSRDKRGYEHFYLVEATTNRRGKTRARVLYWFRTPPGVKVGREPFDAEVRQRLESQNPGVVFDWKKIVETPIPSADAERWRERRREKRALRESQPQPQGSQAEGSQGSGGSQGSAGDEGTEASESLESLESLSETEAVAEFEEFVESSEPHEPLEPDEPREPDD